ncbi:2-oxo acid dehydrogenase subunit E2 [Paraglaciecola psychrophila]|uniref:Dihydrolipoamide acetyltransferase component of pyruvate dehydrogenase complex n=1 Tax=Paraglaciecola psychrophila 170 TaxID=1129794 RepID=K7A6H3_9ALTE|nr:2-oxo acid dehydrogenase subunit E2 [Paraglaciecola psychrophila]AGH45054.1 dihydrolipoamide acetyltransferase [Paraglaciecola psychrophila 170]GAC36398.1 dihydrolipoyllysine-residue acetyltransferase component of pyruvate dehydrogenase complex [Paraglaciecola psychrophila 170]
MQDFILPDIGEGIVECEVVKWLVTQGQDIIEDQPVVEVMTDKALVEIPAKYSGVITKLYYAEGDIAKVHFPLFAMQVTDENSAPLQEPSTVKEVETTETNLSNTVTAVTSKPTHTDTDKENTGKALASPAVRRLARELEIELSQIVGSGDKGRVLKDDLTASASPTLESVVVTPKTTGGKHVEPIRGIQAAMAKHMMHSVFTVPHFSVSEEIEMDKLIDARSQLKASFEKEGVKLSFMPFFIKAMSLALEQFPIINSQINSDCSEVTYFDDHNIGLAVDSKVGLVVPNIKGVQNLSLLEVAKKANELVDLARQGRLSSVDLKGGTISISNIGVLGGTVATPVINAPESAIVALGKIQRLPRFDENDAVKAVNIMHVSWSGDHRIIDGATMVRFNNLWKSYLENPITMLAVTR